MKAVHNTSLPIPQEPLRIAIIGAGYRSQNTYLPLWSSLAPWCVPVAVCDPEKDHSTQMAAALGVPAYTDIRQLVNDRPMEAALVVTPVESHHSISVFLSTNGIPNHTETTWASMVCQAKEMIEVARKNKVVVRVAENFLRMPIDRFAQTVRDHGYLGSIKRIVSYADHTGYHNNSRWIAFTQSHPDWVQSIEHDMEHPAFYSTPVRRHERETLKARFLQFPNGFLVMDVGSGHVKGNLGRHPRPGYTEWQGQRGTLVHRASQSVQWSGEQTELRRCSDVMFAPAQEAAGKLSGGGRADEISPVISDTTGEVWYGMHANTPTGVISYKSPLRSHIKFGKVNQRDWYGVAVMDHVVDFVLAVRNLRESEFTAEDALMSDMMELGARESMLQEGRRIKLPLEGDLEADAIERNRQKDKFGVDPLDIEAMLSISYPRP